MAGRSRDALLWGACGVAFSPVLFDLAAHWASEPWSRYSALFVPLTALRVASARRPARRAADGYLWLALAIGLELFAARADFVRYARPTVALGAVGLARAFALAPAPTVSLALWTTPVPSFAVERLGPPAASALLAAPLAALRALGADLGLRGGRLMGGAELALQPGDGGLLLAALLSGLGWYAADRAGAGVAGRVARAALWGLAAIPLQLAALAGAAAGVTAGVPGAARLGLDALPWVAAAAALAVVHARPAAPSATT